MTIVELPKEESGENSKDPKKKKPTPQPAAVLLTPDAFSRCGIYLYKETLVLLIPAQVNPSKRNQIMARFFDLTTGVHTVDIDTCSTTLG